MNNAIHRSEIFNVTLRRLLLVAAAIVLVGGCGQPEAPVVVPFSVPDEFSDNQGTWERVEGEPTAADNQQIGMFFKQHPDLVGSPEWTGEPKKYLCSKEKSLKRYYWFSGNSENPSWNAIEVNGSRAKQLSGTGSPGTESRE